MATPPTRLGIIAGSGVLPRQVISACQACGQDVFVIAFEGETDAETVQDIPHARLHLGRIGEAMKRLKKEHVEQVLMVGRVGRPAFSKLNLDFMAVRLIGRLARLRRAGDDAIFSSIISFVEDQGFRVVGIKDVLQDNIIGKGPLGKHKPDDVASNDIQIGRDVALTIGKLDIGQAVIVQRGQVLGVEGPEGTDNLIRRCYEWRQEGEGGVLIKMKKPGQDDRVDLPAIGVRTVENAHAGGLRGIAVEAGNALVIEKEHVIERADTLGLFIVGI
ncbi:MAG: UDP-2,3-diacylglucosamine diphosphatase LpxI [Rickettsiales bacterium]|nr:UDP-2,3-diacylglucosamine diphosphatase LpxI [Rickettsiales bacterium]